MNTSTTNPVLCFATFKIINDKKPADLLFLDIKKSGVNYFHKVINNLTGD